MNEFEFIAYGITIALTVLVVGSVVWTRLKVLVRRFGELFILFADVTDDNMITGIEVQQMRSKAIEIIKEIFTIKGLLGLK